MTYSQLLASCKQCTGIEIAQQMTFLLLLLMGLFLVVDVGGKCFFGRLLVLTPNEAFQMTKEQLEVQTPHCRTRGPCVQPPPSLPHTPHFPVFPVGTQGPQLL